LRQKSASVELAGLAPLLVRDAFLLDDLGTRHLPLQDGKNAIAGGDPY
jgi:hypothetical protein